MKTLVVRKPSSKSIRKKSNANSLLYMTILSLVSIVMVFSFLTKKSSGMATASSFAMPAAATSNLDMESRLRGALWGFMSGDALAAPTHWFYGGSRQVKSEYGHLLTDYTKPNHRLFGSIMNKSNLNGGGRDYGRDGSFGGKTIIGDVINHGKKDLWSPRDSVHYHATLQKGENTLEATLARVLMRSIVATNGKFDADHFREAYMKFLQTPGSHNDAYASTCHRMFFANLIFKGLDPKNCPDNDSHNVDTIDGLVLPTIVGLAGAARGDDETQIASSMAACVAVTRKSNILQRTAGEWGRIVTASIKESEDEGMLSTLTQIAKPLIGRAPRVSKSDEMTACYLQQSLPPLLDMIAKYTPQRDAWQSLLNNANGGGENVHRGSVLGAVLGARMGVDNLPAQMKSGLYPQEDLSKEIDEFVKAVLPKSNGNSAEQ